jgi:hypothetical protein
MYLLVRVNHCTTEVTDEFVEIQKKKYVARNEKSGR